MTYKEYFALVDLQKALPGIGVLTITAIFLNYLGNRMIPATRNSPLLQPAQNRRTKTLSPLHLLSSISALLTFVVIAYYLSILQGFGLISMQLYYSLAIATFSSYFIMCFSYVRRSGILLVLSSLVTAVVILSGPVIFGGICQIQATFENGVSGFIFSTSLTREYTLPEACPVGPPCHVYATLPENASDSVFINFHTNIKHPHAVVCYNTSITSSTKRELEQRDPADICIQTHVNDFKAVEWIGQRLVHSVYLFDLTPDTIYRINIYYDGTLQKEEIYQTLPLNSSQRKISIITGGDAGFLEMSFETGTQAAEYKPDLVVMGGDLAYDNGMHTCYDAWDKFLSIFEQMNSVKGMLIPIIFTIGNHDVGIESLSMRTVTKGEDGPPFFTFFPQHSRVGNDGSLVKEVPPTSERNSYFYHLIGGTLQVSLDCGYLADYNGTQLEWMKSLNKNYSSLPKFAVYHAPIYWAFGLWDPVASVIVMGMQHWVPEFDRSRYMSAWENHAHLLKRTKPLRGGTPTENGTMYIGEGCWGVYCLNLPLENSTGIFTKYRNRLNHFWLIELNNETVSYKAISSKGEIVDETWQRYDSYLIENKQ